MHTQTEGYKGKMVAGAKLRARDQVFAYINREFNRSDLSRGSRLPSNSALSKQLGVSISTIQSAFKSLVNEGIIATEGSNGSFLVNSPRIKKVFRLGVGFGFLERGNEYDAWEISITNAIFKRAANVIKDLSVVPIDLTQPHLNDSFSVLEEYQSRVDAVILKADPGLSAKCRHSSSWSVPTVHLTSPHVSATSNFVSADYLSGFLRIGKAFVHSGRKHILYVDTFNMHLGPSGLLRNAGLMGAIGNYGKEIRYEIVASNGNSAESGYTVAERVFTRGSSKPDAIVCTGDLLTIGIKKYCLENGINVPGDVSIIGGTGSSKSLTWMGITQIRQPIEQIGKELVDMVLRIFNEHRDQAGVILPIVYGGGESTTSEENRILSIKEK